MQNSSSKTIKLVVKPAMKKRLEEKAKHLGVSVSTYIKHLILNDTNMPVYEASERVKKAYEESLKEPGILTKGRDAATVLDELMMDEDRD